jgi:CheY-like chemotaxis protein
MRKIVIADDDPDIRELVTMILESQGYQVRAATDGAACLELLAQAVPDLLILDLLMPVMDGFSVCQQIGEGRFPELVDLPILVFTSVQEAASRGRYLRETGSALNVSGYLEKPFSPGTLIGQVQAILGV